MAVIVVATNNGEKWLPGLLASLQEFGTGGHEVLIVDTGSTSETYREYLNGLECPAPAGSRMSGLHHDIGTPGPTALSITATPYKGYDTGAYIWAYRNFEAEDYIFLHDSVLVKHPNWTEGFREKATYNVGCVPWLSFPMQWESQLQIEFVAKHAPKNKWSPLGIFGPMFYAKRDALKELDKAGLLDVYPANKPEQTAFERLWPALFMMCGISVRPVETMFSQDYLFNDRYTHLHKRFAFRL